MLRGPVPSYLYWRCGRTTVAGLRGMFGPSARIQTVLFGRKTSAVLPSSFHRDVEEHFGHGLPSLNIPESRQRAHGSRISAQQIMSNATRCRYESIVCPPSRCALRRGRPLKP